jgi:hypothetical protein
MRPRCASPGSQSPPILPPRPPTTIKPEKNYFQNGNESQGKCSCVAEMGSGIAASLGHHRSFFHPQSSLLNCLQRMMPMNFLNVEATKSKKPQSKPHELQIEPKTPPATNLLSLVRTSSTKKVHFRSRSSAHFQMRVHNNKLLT